MAKRIYKAYFNKESGKYDLVSNNKSKKIGIKDVIYDVEKENIDRLAKAMNIAVVHIQESVDSKEEINDNTETEPKAKNKAKKSSVPIFGTNNL